MMRTFVAGLAIVGGMGSLANAQNIFVGPGSTVDGDYGRGLGVAAYGLGLYNLYTAEAESIHVNTAMRLDTYMLNRFADMRLQYRKRIEEENALHRKLRARIEQRLRENPERLDVLKGEAMNLVMNQLNQKQYVDKGDSALRFGSPALSVDQIRRIRFRIARDNVHFSMQDLCATGKKSWPVGFQFPEFDYSRRRYEKALHRVIDEHSELKISKEAFAELEQSIKGLRQELARIPGPRDGTLHMEAFRRVDELDNLAKMMEHKSFQDVLRELVAYGGTNVNDLRAFMSRHNLTFDEAKTPDQRSLYPDLYVSLRHQLENVQTQEPK